MAVLIPTRQADFHQALIEAGIPVVGISGSGPDCRIDFDDGVTQEQQQQARQLARSFDWTEPTLKQELARQSKKVITSRSPSDIAHRSAIRILQNRLIRALNELNTTRMALRTTRTDLRQLAQQLAAAGLPITVPGQLPLPDVDVMTEEQALAAWKQQIDVEV